MKLKKNCPIPSKMPAFIKFLCVYMYMCACVWNARNEKIWGEIKNKIITFQRRKELSDSKQSHIELILFIKCVCSQKRNCKQNIVGVPYFSFCNGFQMKFAYFVRDDFFSGHQDRRIHLWYEKINQYLSAS